ncbi:MAG: hypothetical protein RR064_07265 [Oscillospiraceae bacterium]
MLEKALKLIIEQQGEQTQGNFLYFMGQHVGSICVEKPEYAELIANDLEVESMNLKALEKVVHNSKKGILCNMDNDPIIRKFYGLPSENKTYEELLETENTFIKVKQHYLKTGEILSSYAAAPIETQCSPSDSIFDLQNLFD